MLFTIVFVYFLLYPIVALIMLGMIIYKLDNQNNKIKDNTKKFQRKHTSIQNSNYQSVFSKRGEQKVQFDYSKYKNKSGLYTPVKPKNSIEISKEKEE